MGLFRRARLTKDAAAEVALEPSRAEHVQPTIARPDARPGDDHSDVFVCRRDDATPAPMALEAKTTVTLFVTGWHNVEPGPLSWAFPSLRSALEAVRKMKNAVEWSIVAGDTWPTLDDARANGAVLIEQLG